MNRYIKFLIFSFIVVSCNDEKKSSNELNINFKLVYGGSPLVLLKDYTYPDGRSMLFNRVSFFVSGVELSSIKAKSVSSEVKMVNFNSTNGSLSGALNGNLIKFSGFAEGDISKMKFCVGVDKASNSKRPSDFKNSHSLSDQSEYWSGWRSYIFMRLEGFLDSNRDGKKNLGFALHTGSDDTFRCFEFPVNFKISSSSENRINVILDVQKIFGQGTKIFNIDAHPQIHSQSQIDQAIELANNLNGAFSVQ